MISWGTHHTYDQPRIAATVMFQRPGLDMHARYETDFLQLLHLLPSSYFSDSIEHDILQSSVTFQLTPKIICTYCWYYKNNTDKQLFRQSNKLQVSIFTNG